MLHSMSRGPCLSSGLGIGENSLQAQNLLFLTEALSWMSQRIPSMTVSPFSKLLTKSDEFPSYPGSSLALAREAPQPQEYHSGLENWDGGQLGCPGITGALAEV